MVTNHRLAQEDIDAKSQFSLDAQICEEKTFSNKDTNARVKATRIHGGAILRGCKRQNILIVALQDKTAVPQCCKTICLLQHDAYFHTIICIKVPCKKTTKKPPFENKALQVCIWKSMSSNTVGDCLHLITFWLHSTSSYM